MGALAFKVLGPLEIRHEGGLVPVRGVREQVVLAVLLLEAGHAVQLTRLVQAVWDRDPPQTAEKAVRNTVSALRSRLGHAEQSQTFIETGVSGYRLRLGDSSLDAARFADRAVSARHLAGTGRAGEAVTEFRAALRLWRGPALAGLGGLVIEATAARLDEQRLTAWEECLDLELRLGRHREVTDELRVLVSEHPLRERLAGQLMLALYRAGRQAEALDSYHRLAKQLADDLGLDTSGEITKLHEAILRQDPVLTPPVSSGEADWAAAVGDRRPEWPAGMRDLLRGYARELAGTQDGCQRARQVQVEELGIRLDPGPPEMRQVVGADISVPLPELPGGPRLAVPRELPTGVQHFIGRAEELEMLTGLLKDAGNETPGTVVISAIGGTAGVG